VRWTAIVWVGLVACGRSDRKPAPPELPSCPGASGPISGEGTHYAADGTGSCSFAASPGHRMVAAISSADYAHAAWCGACVEVTGPNGDVVVRIVDRCPGCKSGDLDLSREAFAEIAPISAGRIPISWRPVACEVAGPIAYQLKDGSNPFWTAIQVLNHRYPIATFEARDRTGAWKALPRSDDNHFVSKAGLGRGPYALRVTDTRGHALEDSLALGDAVAGPGAAQLAICRD
jgi:expansin (peptidoglycan-binding protein)